MMQGGPSGAVIWVVVIVIIGVLFLQKRHRRRPRTGAAAAGTIYDMLNQDKRKAIEVIVEDRAAARDPEDRDGNLPDLEAPRKSG
jgi:hypothetical protein